MDSRVSRPGNLARGGNRLRVALDSGYLIALLSDWHSHHQRTLRSYEHWLDDNAQIVLPVHAILECYSVLTRIPAPYRRDADVARQAIARTFAETALVVGVKAIGIWEKMESLSRLGIRGGQVYDALITWCAAEAGATVLLTWNVKHFEAIAPATLEVREP